MECKNSATADNTAVQVSTYNGSSDNNQLWYIHETVVLNTPLIGQEKSNWCWAASALMAAKTYDSDITVTQTQIVQQITGTDQDVPGSINDTLNAANFAAGVDDYTIVYNVSSSLLLQHTIQGNPILLRRGKYDSAGNRNGGHITVVCGYRLLADGTLEFLINDPWPVNSGESYYLTYDEIAYNNISNSLYHYELDNIFVRPL